jgi:hypothetical protein
VTAPSLRRPPSWALLGACNGMVTPGWDPWLPDEDLPAVKREQLQRIAVDVCSGCAVRAKCLDDALATGEAWSVRGGLTPADRRALAATGGAPRPSPFGAAQHGTNSMYAAHGCRCGPCTGAHARYVAGWRQTRRWTSPATSGLTVVVHELHVPAGAGRRRAFPGQLFIEIGEAA